LIREGFEVVAGSQDALCDRGGAEDSTVDSVVKGEAAAANDRFIGALVAKVRPM